MKDKQVKISDLVPDNKNYNKGNEFGNSLIEKSLKKLGAGRSILLDKNNRIIAGNKTIENAGAIGLEDVQIVESDGKRIIAVKRTDIDLDSKLGREMALADNAAAKANIEWDIAVINEDWTKEEQSEWGLNFEFEGEDELREDYSSKIGEVVYEPKTSSHQADDLFTKETKFDEEIAMIEDEGIKEMLKARASFFSSFNYSKIADYYAYQATPQEKEIFEKLALVLLDKDQLIANGFSNIMEMIMGENGFND